MPRRRRDIRIVSMGTVFARLDVSTRASVLSYGATTSPNTRSRCKQSSCVARRSCDTFATRSFSVGRLKIPRWETRFFRALHESRIFSTDPLIAAEWSIIASSRHCCCRARENVVNRSSVGRLQILTRSFERPATPLKAWPLL